MRLDGVFIAGTGLGLPQRRITVDEAISRKRYTEKYAAKSRQVSVTVADAEQYSPDLAVIAARQALGVSGLDPSDVGLLLFAVSYETNMGVWPSASYVQAHTVTDQCLVSELRNGCNGSGAMLEMACPWLSANPSRAALLTAADRWHDPGWDRWQTLSDLLYGDGGSAVLLSRRGGWGRLVSLVTRTDTGLERLIRGERPFDGAGQLEMAERPDLPKEEIKRRQRVGMSAVAAQAMAEADIEVAEADHVLLPFIGYHIVPRYVEAICDGAAALMDVCMSRLTAWEWGAGIGHLGSGDHFAALHYLAESGKLGVGQRVLLVSEGAGYTWSAAVVEVDETPYI